MIKKNKLYILFPVFFLFLSIAGYANPDRIGLKYIELGNNVPSSSVRRVFQDSDGLMWLGTPEGLYRYDGYRTIVFRSDHSRPNLLTGNNITSLAEDKSGYLWVGTQRGITLLDKKTYAITHFDHELVRDKYIHSITVTRDGTIWIGAGENLLTFNPDRTLCKDYRQQKPVSQVISVYEDPDGQIWVCRPNSGLFKYDPVSDTFIEFPPLGQLNAPFRIFQDNRKQYWVCTWGDGLYRFSSDKGGETVYTEVQMTDQTIHQPELFCFSILQDDVNAYIWVMSHSGLTAFSYTPEGNPEKVDISGVLRKTNNIFSEIIKDRDGNLWIGAYFEGAILLCFDQPDMYHMDLPEIKERLGHSPNVMIYEDRDGVLWFSQNRYGLGFYDPKTGRTRLYKDFPGIAHIDGFYDITCFTMLPDSDDMLFGSGHSSEIYTVRKEKNDLKVIHSVNLPVLFSGVGSPLHFLIDKKKNLWVGTSNGLVVRPHDSPDFRMVCHYTGRVTGLTEDIYGTIWASSDSYGLFRIPSTYQADWARLEVIQYQKENSKLPDNNLQSISADLQGRIWIGTSEGGLIAFVHSLQEFVDYTHRSRMSGDAIQDVITDERGHIWITTARQITEYNPENDAFFVYNHSDGILVNSFIKNAVCRSQISDYMHFGGNMGVTSIKVSDKLDRAQGNARALVTDIKINNQSILWEGADQRQFDRYGHELKLKPEDRNLEIDFSALNYSYPDKVQYAYKLSGVDKDWVIAGDNRQFATYNQLKKGNYTFHLKVTDQNNVWSDDVTVLTIRKQAAFYETWWAYTLYVCVVLFVIALIIRFFLNRMQLQNELRIAQIEKEKSEELAQTKLHYFTNISHDLLTPLTIISCSIDDIETTQEKKIPQFDTMRSNVNRLRRLLQQILDFRKIEAGHIKLKITQGDIISFIREICSMHFSPIIKRKNIDFTFQSDAAGCSAYFDADKMDKILCNILSNAFKYTPDGGRISVGLQSEERDGHTYLSVYIRDTGVGIEEADLKNIFTRFYFNKRTDVNQTNGIGLSVTKDLVELHHGHIFVTSKINEGTTFVVEIPIDKASYSAEEIIQSSLHMAKEDAGLLQTASEDPVKDSLQEQEQRDVNLLLVEDNEELLATIRKILSRQYHVFTATNGVEAIREVNSNAIDIIVSDVMMPEMDGLELCRTLKNNIETSHIPILLLTAKASVEDRVACYNAGADGYISKPFELKVLEARIRNFLFNKRKQQNDFKTDVNVNVSKLEYTSIDEQFLNKAVQLIEEHMSDTEFDNEAFAQHMHLSKSTLYRKLKTMTGLSPIEFIRNIRLKYACTLLENQTTTISEVAYACGFAEPKYFSSCFKTEFNMTPSEYQSQYSVRQADHIGNQ